MDKIDLLLSDPSYGIDWDTNYTRFTGERGVNQIYRPVFADDQPFDPAPWLKFDEVILWGANCYSNRLPLGSLLVWDKRFKNGEAFLADGEAAFWSHGHGVYIFPLTWQGSVKGGGAITCQHPTQKPVALMRWCIEKSHSTQIILDPYLGSGTTLRAAKDLRRKAVGIEIEECYCEIAARRCEQEVLAL